MEHGFHKQSNLPFLPYLLLPLLLRVEVVVAVGGRERSLARAAVPALW